VTQFPAFLLRPFSGLAGVDNSEAAGAEAVSSPVPVGTARCGVEDLTSGEIFRLTVGGQMSRSSSTELVAPPRRDEAVPISGSLGMILVPAASGVGAVLLAVTQQSRPLLAAAGLLVLAASIAVGLVMVIGSRTGARRRTREQRERYLDYLEQVRLSTRAEAADQRRRAARAHRDPTTLASTALASTALASTALASTALASTALASTALASTALASTALAGTVSGGPWRRRGAGDFLVLRVGLGVVPLRRPVTLPISGSDPLVAYDPVCLAAAVQLSTAYSVMDDQPICLSIAAPRVVSIVGRTDRRTAAVRAFLAQLVSTHDPDEAAVMICSPDRADTWEWLNWLPHHHSQHSRDGPLPARLFTDSVERAAALLIAEFDRRIAGGHPASRPTMVIVDGAGEGPLDALLSAAAAAEASVILLLPDRRAEPGRVDVRVLIGDRLDLVQTADGLERPCRVDALEVSGARLLARSLAPVPAADQPPPPSADGDPADPLRPAGILAIDPAVSWRARSDADLLRVPIGTAPDGSPVLLDLKEAARGGIGPHGLLVGATGTGKSELLRTLVTALVARHPPASLALLLADFKGGATFSGFAGLPHLAGMITNLEADRTLIDRFRDALGGEVQRRQELLAAAGRLTSLDSYLDLRRHRADLEPLPRLLVVVDEFSELLGARPDLADLFVTIGRIGRSIGIHLLLATQRLDTGRIRGLESHLSYRICLRTFSESESREAIGTVDAYHLPAEPGWGYLRGAGPEPRRFRAVTLSRPFREPPTGSPARGRGRALGAPPPVLPFGAAPGVAGRIWDLHDNRCGEGVESGGRAAVAGGGRRADAAEGRVRTWLDVAVERISAGAAAVPDGQPARQVWLEPLPARVTLSEVLRRRAAPLGPDESSASVALEGIPGGGRVLAILGVVDVPERQRQDVLEWDFSTGNGNLLIVGAGRSGKSTAVRTLLLSLALRHSPAELEIFCVDHGGGSLVSLGELPQVAAVAGRSDPELTRLVFARLAGLMSEREAAVHRGDPAAALLRSRTSDDRSTRHVVVIIDGWAALHEGDDWLDRTLDDVLTRGPGVGVHTVLTVGSPSQLRARLAAGFGGRIELRLADSFDSAIDRRLAKALPADRPGRALVAGGHCAQLALPVLDTGVGGADGSSCDEVAPATHDLGPVDLEVPDRPVGPVDDSVATVRGRWPGQSVPKIRTLPARISLVDMYAQAAATAGRGRTERAHGPLLGLAEEGLVPVRLDLLDRDPHLVVYGDSRAGKTSLLRNVLAQLPGSPPAAPADAAGAAIDSPAAPGESAREGAEIVIRSPVEVLVVDYRNGLARAADGADQIGTGAAEATAICAAVAAELAGRVTRRQNRRRTTSPEPMPATGPVATPTDHRDPAVYLLVDDYDLVCAGPANPLLALLPFLPHAREIGFHLVLARRTGGAARAQYEPVLQTLADLGGPVLLLSGSPGEGRIAHGVAPQILPPGRARLVSREHAPQLLQLAWVP